MRARSLLERAAAPLTGASAAAFAALSAVRNKRVFHPVGRAFAGTLTLSGEAGAWLPTALTLRPEHPVVMRFSRGIGLPEPLPDLLGLAVKIRGVYGARDQDWLLVTSGFDAITRHALIPALDFLARPYSSVLPYRLGGRLVTFGARAAADGRRARSFDALADLAAAGELTFALTVAPEGGDHVRIGALAATQRLTVLESRSLRFDPWNSAPDMTPAGALNQLRRSAYPASQRARPD